MGEIQRWTMPNGCYVLHSDHEAAIREKDAEIERLRSWVKAAADVLGDHEWSEQLPTDPDLQELEAQISALIGRNGYTHTPNEDLQEDLDCLTQAVNQCGCDVTWECGDEPGVRVKNVLASRNLDRSERAEAQRDELLAKAREVAAWIRSGNSRPTYTRELLAIRQQRFLNDVQDLDSAVAAIDAAMKEGG